MILFASELEEHIVDIHGNSVDDLETFLLDPSTGRIVKIIGKRSEFLAQDCSVEEKRLVAHKIFAIRDAGLKSRKRTGISLINLPVVTESGDSLGRVTDFSFESALLVLDSIVTAKRLIPWSKRILGRRQIIEISSKRIVVSDQYAPETGKPVYPEVIPA